MIIPMRFSPKAGVDIILLGDSVGIKVLGYKNPAQVTMEDMVHHLKAVPARTI